MAEESLHIGVFGQSPEEVVLDPSGLPQILQMDSEPSSGLSLVSVISLLACSAQVLVAAALTCRYGARSSTVDRWVLTWLFYDVIVHLTLVRPVRFRFYCSCLTLYLNLSQSGLFVCSLPVVSCPSVRKVRLSSCLWLGQWRRLKVHWLNSVSFFD